MLYVCRKKMKLLFEYLREVKDHRRAQGVRTPMNAFSGNDYFSRNERSFWV